MTLTARVCRALAGRDGQLVTAVDVAVATGEDRRRVARALARLRRRSEAVQRSHSALAGNPRRWRTVYAVTGSADAAARRHVLVAGPRVEAAVTPAEADAADFDLPVWTACCQREIIDCRDKQPEEER